MSNDASTEPVLIPIVYGSSDEDEQGDASDVPEWAMIEVNGELVLPSDLLLRGRGQPKREKENQSTELELSTDSQEDGSASQSVVSPHRIELGSLRFVDKKPVMILGSHELTGKGVEKLAKPFCVLQRSKDGSSYEIKGVVTRKVLLNQYPKIIMR